MYNINKLINKIDNEYNATGRLSDSLIYLGYKLNLSVDYSRNIESFDKKLREVLEICRRITTIDPICLFYT